MRKIMLMLCIIMGVAAGCASTGNDKEGRPEKGENIPLDAVEAGEMP